MADRRHFEAEEVVDAAKQVFWDRGYAGTAIDDLQAATGLSRSSLYLAFGTKRAVFDAALADHVATFLDPQLRRLEAHGAGLSDAVAYFRWLAEYFAGADASRGCLYINSISELAGRDPTFTPAATEFTNRVRAAFRNSVGDGAGTTMDSARPSQRAAMLTAAFLGAWLHVRSDAGAAAAGCLEIADEITSWGPLATGSVGVNGAE